MKDIKKKIDTDVVCLQEVVLSYDMNSYTDVESIDGWKENIIQKFKELGYNHNNYCATDNTNHIIDKKSFFGNAIF